MKKIKSFFLSYFLPLLIAPIVYFYSRTWRWKISGNPESLRKFVFGKESVIYAHWHGDELVLVPFYSFKNLCVLSSLSKDGTIMANVLRLLGYTVFRGSSTRGGARGLIALIRHVREGRQAALAVDGPKGPIYEVKPGVIELSERAQTPIVAVGVKAENVWMIPRAWNRSFVPKPFSKVEVCFSEEIYLENKKHAKRSDAQLQKTCSLIKEKLNELPFSRYW